ncbi:hypothetical protein EVAR_73763_1 [Eumeta japonica]|uniref:Uncharacterized protein n=1 Tax=Eumeta variegata TaxID=151549 RepID=A0A4C1TK83_EUMVA|nr:hypothetical protein EVAR_73763_1 [Eumeta japonica]
MQPTTSTDIRMLYFKDRLLRKRHLALELRTSTLSKLEHSRGIEKLQSGSKPASEHHTLNLLATKDYKISPPHTTTFQLHKHPHHG